jgi:hypothetical protein
MFFYPPGVPVDQHLCAEGGSQTHALVPNPEPGQIYMFKDKKKPNKI